MREPQVEDSRAFRLAQLQSDRIRILAVIASLCVLVVATMLRRLIFAGESEKPLLTLFPVFFIVMIGYELLMLYQVRRAQRLEADLSTPTVILTVFVETLFPTTGIILLIVTGLVTPYMALVAPIALTYFLFVILSTLRLSPMLARLTAVFCAGEYALVAIGVYLRFPAPNVNQAMRPIEFCLGNIVVLLAGGMLAGEVARQIRLHIGRALREAHEVERVTSQLETARFVQRSLLPQETPQLEGYDLAGWNQPADQTGGDYYGWLQLGDGRTAVALADVTGPGIDSALLAVACHAYLQASTSQDAGLDGIVTRMNRWFCSDLPPGKLVTFVAGVLDAPSGCVELLSAGHAPLLFYSSAEDKVHRYDAHGVPFGILGAMAYGPAQKLMLAPGDMLVLITDGFFEWTNAADEDFGLDRLCEATRAARDLPAAGIISALHAAVSGFAGSTPQQDDLTAVVLKRL